MRKKYHDKTTSSKKSGRNERSVEAYEPKWFGDNENTISQYSEDQSRRLQFNRNPSGNGGGTGTVHGRKKRIRRAVQNSPRGNDSDQRGTKANLEEGARNQGFGIIRITFKEIRDNLSDEDLISILEQTFLPNKEIIIKRKIRNFFAEDEFLPQKTNKIRSCAKKKRPAPSEMFKRHVSDFENKKINGDPKVVLGYYFILYKKLFKEEDPTWAGKDASELVIMVAQMADELDIKYEDMIIFVKKIMPLWHYRLSEGEPFPDTRPTVKNLFSGNRHFWANRHLYIRRWQPR